LRTRPPAVTLLVGASAFVSVLLGSGLVAVVVLLELDTSYEPAQSVWSSLPDILMALAFAIVGAIVTLKRPGNLVGWALSLAGVGLLFGGLLGAYGELALLAKPEVGLPAGRAAGAVAVGSWTPLMAGVFLLILTFPAGRLAGSRWRPVARVVPLGFAIVWIVISTAPGHLDPPLDTYENPLAVTSSKAYALAVFPIAGVCLVCVALAAIDLLRRFRRSRGDERQQFKWFAGSAGLLLLVLPFAVAFNYSAVPGALFAVALIALPVSVGIAILRYRLYEIDRIVNRTLVYGAVSALLAGLYFGIVVALQQVFSGFAGGSELAVAGSTLAVAALFRPARRRIQALVDRRFYRRRYDAQRTLEAFSARLRDEIDLDTLAGELRGVVHETMQPAHVSLWLRDAVTIPGRSPRTKEVT
jgi:MFS family permease